MRGGAGQCRVATVIIVALLAASDASDHSPEHGTLTLRDTEYVEPLEGEERLGLWATDVQPCGTFVRAGVGWLEGAAGDGPLTVRLELHDAPPPRDTWDDVAETPYRTTGGQVILTCLDGGTSYAALDLRGADHHRVRATRNRGAYDADTWRLQFWPVTTLEPPHWLVRSMPAVARGADDTNAHRCAASDLVSVVLWAGPGPFTTTEPELARRLLMPAEDVRSTVRYAERAGVLAVERDEHGGLALTGTAPLVR